MPEAILGVTSRQDRLELAVEQNIFYCINDRFWCNSRGIVYSNPDIEKAKDILYFELKTGRTYLV